PATGADRRRPRTRAGLYRIGRPAAWLWRNHPRLPAGDRNASGHCDPKCSALHSGAEPARSRDGHADAACKARSIRCGHSVARRTFLQPVQELRGARPTFHRTGRGALCVPADMNGAVLLAIAIIGEVVATSFLKASNGFTELVPTLVVVIGYAITFYFFSLALQTIPVGIAYAIWSGSGIVLIALIAY